LGVVPKRKEKGIHGHNYMQKRFYKHCLLFILRRERPQDCRTAGLQDRRTASQMIRNYFEIVSKKNYLILEDINDNKSELIKEIL
jgi:hypothetical protein